MKRSLYLLALCVAASACDFPRLRETPDAAPPDGAAVEPPMLLLIAPAANAYTGAFIPVGATTRFAWTAPPNVTSFDLEIATSRDFNNGRNPFTVSAMSHAVDLQSLYGNVFAPVGRRLYWRVTACVRTSCSTTPPRALNFGRSSRDLNGDGFADIAIASPYGTQGKASVYFGGSNGPDQTVDGALSGTLANDLFGQSLASGGDFNGDGFADLIVGAPGNLAAGTNDCSANIYLGGSGATFNTTLDAGLYNTLPYEIGQAVSPAGDFNGDGYDDFVIGAPGMTASNGRVTLLLSSPQLNLTPKYLEGNGPERVGLTLASAGDFNNDGYADILVGTSRNKVYLFLGSAAASLTNPITLTTGSTSEAFGSAMSAGDINGDGFSDVLIGAPSNSAAGVRSGRAYLFFGHANPPLTINTPSVTFSGNAPENRLGISVSASGDFNRDGFADVVIGAPGSQDGGASSNTGSFYVYYGGNPFNSGVNAKIVGGTNEYLGSVISAVGDTNGDRFDDLLVGTASTAQPLGRAYLYRGGITVQFDPSADNIYTGTVNNAGFGTSIAAVGRPRDNARFAQCAMKRT